MRACQVCGILYDIRAPGAGYLTCGAARCQYRRESDTREKERAYAKATNQQIADRRRERYRTEPEYREGAASWPETVTGTTRSIGRRIRNRRGNSGSCAKIAKQGGHRSCSEVANIVAMTAVAVAGQKMAGFRPLPEYTRVEPWQRTHKRNRRFGK